MTTEILTAQNCNQPNMELLDLAGITDRELDIMKHIAEGLSNKEISELLNLTEGTIKNKITNILSKLELRDRTQIAIFMLKNNIMT